MTDEAGRPVTGRRWLGIIGATLIWALAFWFGILALPTQRVTALAIMGVGMVFAIYVLALMSGNEQAPDVAFRASLAALAAGSLLALVSLVVDDDRLAVAAAIAAPGVGGAAALAPVGDRVRLALRLVVVGLLSVIGVALYGTDSTVFGLLAPLYVLPALAVADAYLDRVRGVLPDPSSD